VVIFIRAVKCVFCGSSINRQVDEYVIVQKRYAHTLCSNEQQQEKEDRAQLNKILYEIFGENLNFGVVGQQIKNYKNQYNFTISGIIGTLYYCYKIINLDPRKAQGIGIVPFYYKEARSYFNAIENAKNNLGALNIQKKIVHIKSPKAEPLIKFREISLNYLNEEGDDH
jgi:hypothetical protein